MRDGWDWAENSCNAPAAQGGQPGNASSERASPEISPSVILDLTTKLKQGKGLIQLFTPLERA
jgi:hypothetical protein